MKYRLVHIVPGFSPGGAERLAVNMLTRLPPERYHCSAISLYGQTGSDLEEILRQKRIETVYLGKGEGRNLGIVRQLAAELRRIRPDILHTHLGILSYVLPGLIIRRPPAMVHTVHNLAEREVEPRVRWLHRLAFRLGVVPVSIAREVSQSITRLYGLRSFPEIPNGIPVEEYRSAGHARSQWRAREGFSESDLLLVSIARLRPQKNHRMLIEAFAGGPGELPGARLILVGDGEEEASLRALAAATGLGDRIHFLGARTDVPEILAAADAFVLSSDWEGNPLAVMEGLAAGLPVLCTAVGGIPELVTPGVTGLLVPAGDVAAFSRSLLRLCREPTLRAELGRAAAADARRFGIEAMVHRYEELYMSLLRRPAPR